jgi:hypothetical protein
MPTLARRRDGLGPGAVHRGRPRRPLGVPGADPMRYFWLIMENDYVVWGARLLAGYMAVFAWLATLGSQL